MGAAASLAPSLALMARLTSLDLSYNAIGAAGGASLAASLAPSLAPIGAVTVDVAKAGASYHKIAQGPAGRRPGGSADAAPAIA